jgi:hypothetical protein
MRKAGQRPDDQIAIIIAVDKVELGDVMNINQIRELSFAFMQLDQYIGAAGNQMRLGILF